MAGAAGYLPLSLQIHLQTFSFSLFLDLKKLINFFLIKKYLFIEHSPCHIQNALGGGRKQKISVSE